METGTVRVWHDELGWGVLDSAATPGGCWVHFSHLVMPGHHALAVGDEVRFTFEPAEQDGYDYRAILVWPPGAPVSDEPPPHRSMSAAYRSSLTITPDDGTHDT